MSNVLVAYYSLGKNTKVAAEQLIIHLKHFEPQLQVTCIALQEEDYENLPIESYDVVFLGSPTYGKGKTPAPVRAFLRYLLKENEFNLPPFAVFGTGDTQWGDFLYARAVDELTYHLEKKTDVLASIKIEQRPMAKYQKAEMALFVAETLALQEAMIKKGEVML